MFGSTILEVAIGIIFVYMLVSIICSAIREGIEAKLKTRAAYLERGIRELLHDGSGKGLTRSIYEHPLIYSLYSGRYRPGSHEPEPPMFARGTGLPSYIPSASFANALMDIVVRGPDPLLASDPDAPQLTVDNVRASIINIQNEPVQRVLLTALDAAHGNLDRARDNIAAWYDSSMDRVSGWYRRSTQWIIFAIGIAVAVGLNVNTITIIDFLYRNDTAREAIVARAEAASRDSTFLSSGYEQAKQELAALQLPIGWSAGWGAPRRGDEASGAGLWNNLFAPLIGWLLTALAATLGAPFWFDLLNKMMVVRSTVKPREKSQEEGSEDRQPKKSQRIVVTPPPSTAPDAAAAATAAATVASNAATQPVLRDACDIPIMHVTHDEDLPAAEGGVA